MSRITVARNVCVLTETRGWQFVEDLTLKDKIKCVTISTDQEH